MEYLKVAYDKYRRVFIDDDHTGFTNRRLRLEEGTHVVNLGDPVNYTPAAFTIDLTGTSLGKPMVITFVRKS